MYVPWRLCECGPCLSVCSLHQHSAVTGTTTTTDHKQLLGRGWAGAWKQEGKTLNTHVWQGFVNVEVGGEECLVHVRVWLLMGTANVRQI